jgi:hypothetical protein
MMALIASAIMRLTVPALIYGLISVRSGRTVLIVAASSWSPTMHVSTPKAGSIMSGPVTIAATNS